MAVEKISISVDEDTLADARRCAEAEGVSLSAWLVEAAKDRARLLGWQRLVREYEDEFGAFTEEERAEADAWIDESERQLRELRRTRGR